MSERRVPANISAASLLTAIEGATQAGIAAVDSDGVQAYANPAFCRMLGFEADELVGQRAPFPYWPVEERQAIQDAFAATVAGRAPTGGFELRFQRKDGSRIDVHLALAPIIEHQETIGWLASVHDVTSRKRAESQLFEAQRLARIGSWHWDVTTGAVTWSPELFRQYGRDPKTFEPTLDGFLDALVDEDRPRVQDALQRALEDDEPYSLDMRVRRPDGEIRVQRVLARVERDDEGQPLQMFGTSQDVTEQKQDEERRLDDTIQRIALSAGQDLGDEGLAARITEEATSLCGAAAGWLLLGGTTLEMTAQTVHASAAELRSSFRTAADLPARLRKVLDGVAIRIDDMPMSIGPSPGEREPPLRSFLGVPVQSRTGEVLGGLFFAHHEPDRFTERHARLMSVLAGHAAVALDNGRLYAQLRSSEELSRAARVEAERSAAVLEDQRTVLELIASGAPLPQTLEELARAVERHADTRLRASILLLNAEAGTLHLGAGPNLPDEYNAAIEGVQIGPSVGSCGTAAYLGEEVVATDILTDPRWAEYRGLASQHGLRACWSTPIRASDGRILGTFAIYHDKPHSPTEDERRLVYTLNRTAAIAIDRKHVEGALQEANQRKDEFLALLGHELRNPLAPILTALEIMELRGIEAADERAAIDRHVRHMMQLVDDLLDVSRITRGKLELDRAPMRLAEVLADAAEMAAPLLETRAHHLNMAVDPSMVVDGDAVRLAQVFANLLTNSAKYTPPGGQIDVETSVAGDDLIVTVTDNGVGISPELLAQVFEPFIQGERSIDRSHGGLGLGLPLVHTLVGLHGGEVEASSAGPGHGTRITVRLPRSLSAPKELPRRRKRGAASIGFEGSAPARKTVLLVDDNKDAAFLLEQILNMAGYEVTVAHDGVEALEYARNREFDSAIVDIGLPIMDGYELGRRLLEHRPIHLIAVTGYGQENDRRQSAEVGFAAHLVKPVEHETLIEALETTEFRDSTHTAADPSPAP